MKRLLAFITNLALMAFATATGQTIAPDSNTHLAQLFESLRASTTDSAKAAINSSIEKELTDTLTSNPNSFEKDFGDLRNLGKCYSDDHKVRIYSWNYPQADRTNHYSCLIQMAGQKKIRQLKMKQPQYIPSKGAVVRPDNWYGALYYKIFLVKNKKKSYYVLLGWSGYDMTTDYKVVETLSIDDRGNVTLGKETPFEENGVKSKRIVLQYSDNAKVSLEYFEDKKIIVFDHLVPTDPIYKGIYSYYGPDFTYDAYELVRKPKGTWTKRENIDIKNKE